eukprot:m.308148 g.308148  ORF g.308148 m.308148 type:complete len:81 (-) comp16472_c0_seq14:841-1083(-)
MKTGDEIMYDEAEFLDNPLRASIFNKAKEKFDATHAFVCLPWSPSTNNWGKWECMQKKALTILLVAERLCRANISFIAAC